ncbi:MAG: hypothetical protein M3Z37_09440, partial [Candidatus Eremiobacteraeota bacterium]|nr:hypothetical protein [Candidatus Eremiobacteraeota bacterium]
GRSRGDRHAAGGVLMLAQVRNLVAAAAVIAVATLAMGVEAPVPSRTALTLPGHSLGIGEQQVFVIDRMADLNLRFRDDLGRVHATHYRSHLTSSIAFTIEGVSSAGTLVLGLALPGSPQPQSSQAQPVPPVTPLSPPPSPELDQGATLPTRSVADFSPASILMSGLTDDLLNAGRPWKSAGSLSLPYGRVNVNMVTTRAAAAADQATTVAHLVSDGSAEVRGKLTLKGVGQTSFNGNGRATASAYVDAQNELLLGMTLTTYSQGNARARRDRGSYDLHVQLAIKLVHYVPGIPLLTGPGSVVASGHLGTIASPDQGNISTAPANPVAVPAVTDTGFVGSPLPTLQPSALPEASLPPIPLPMDSSQPIVSPPPGPTPTQTPFRY